MTVEIRVPALGESVTEATVATWFKQPGDHVATDEMLCELETDKVTVEVPAPAAGTLKEIIAPEGTTVAVGAPLALMDEAGAESTAATPPPGGETAAAPLPSAPAAAAAAPASGTDASGRVDVLVPTLGESVTEATVATWFKQPGESVTADEMLCELETDKVSVEVPAPAPGTLAKILAPEGSSVTPGARLASIATGAAGAVAGTGTAAASVPSRPGRDVEDAPSARKAMAEAGLAPGSVRGTGRNGRVMKEDVQKAVAAAKAPSAAPAGSPAITAAPAPATPEDDAPREERVKMTRLRQTIARRLKEAQNTAAILTTYNEADMSAVMDIRNSYKELFQKKHGIKLGFMSFFVKACVHALKEVPDVNAEIDGNEIVYKNYVHMGVAVGTPSGLVVPVIRNADRKDFATIEKEIAALGRKAREGKLAMTDMQGGTFTISNGGVYGSLLSSPILNPPQSGILGMHKIQERPVAANGEVVIRPMMYLALSYDHRIVDGKGAVTFLVRVKEVLEDPRRLLMDL